MSIVTMLACAALFLAAGFVSDAKSAIVLITAAAFFGSIAGPVAYAITIDMGGRHVPTVFSIMNMSGNIGAAAFPVVVGILVEWTEAGIGFPAFVAGIYVAGSMFWFALDTSGTVFDREVGRMHDPWHEASTIDSFDAASHMQTSAVAKVRLR